MTVVGRLAVLFWQRGGSRQRTTLALTAAGVAASVVLALLALSVSPAVSIRGDHTAWRTATAAPIDAASALQRTTTDRFADRDLTRIDLAPTGRGTPPPPPGLRAFPADGQVWVSPALADLLASEPAEVLADRFPGPVVGQIGPIGLGHDDELVAVVGHGQGALPAAIDPRDSVATHVADGDVVPIDGFARHGIDDQLDLYRTLARMAAVLLVVPTLLLIGAAARLTAAQREQRLAVLRLVGAGPRVVVGLTALEIGLAAAVGTVAGVVGYLAVLPLAARIPLGGGTFPVGDLRLGLTALAAATVLVPVAAAVSAAVALRQVVAGPLGVSRRTPPARPRLLRFLVVPLAWVAFVSSAQRMRDGGSTTGALLGLGAVIATLSVIGPWVTWLLGAVLGRLARRPATLIAARRIGDDPKGAYRTVSGMVLAGLVAGFLFAVLPTMEAADLGDTRPRAVQVDVAAARAEALGREVRAADPGARVVLSRGRGDDVGSSATDVDRGRSTGMVVASSPERLDLVRTAVLRADPVAVLEPPDDRPRYQAFLDDLGRASIVMAVASLLMAAAAIATSASASILDQRTTLARLRLVGTPIATLQRARRWQTLLPLVLASSGAMAMGAVAGLVMLTAFAVRPERIADPALAPMVLLGLAAAAAGAAVVAATRPLLVSVSRVTPRG